MTEENKCYFSMTPEEVADQYGIMGVFGFLQSYSDPRVPGYKPPTEEEEAKAATERLRKFNEGLAHLKKTTPELFKRKGREAIPLIIDPDEFSQAIKLIDYEFTAAYS